MKPTRACDALQPMRSMRAWQCKNRTGSELQSGFKVCPGPKLPTAQVQGLSRRKSLEQGCSPWHKLEFPKAMGRKHGWRRECSGSLRHFMGSLLHLRHWQWQNWEHHVTNPILSAEKNPRDYRMQPEGGYWDSACAAHLARGFLPRIVWSCKNPFSGDKKGSL